MSHVNCVKYILKYGFRDSESNSINHQTKLLKENCGPDFCVACSKVISVHLSQNWNYLVLVCIPSTFYSSLILVSQS